jgi:imidazolonepropionase
MPLRAVVHASELFTGSGVRQKDGKKIVDSDLGRIVDGALVYQTRVIGNQEVPSRIEWVGPSSEIPKKWKNIPHVDLRGKKAVAPGLVDCHTHLVFAGDRSEEFSARCAGATYEEIAKNGGGIQSTVRATRAATEGQLIKLASDRLREIYRRGVRTVEIKSGYGLSFESEMRVLKVISQLRKKFPQMTLTSTYLGAHAIPSDGDRVEYIEEMIHRTIPEVARKKLADSCDVFIDEGYFTRDEGREILLAAQRAGLNIKIHADELTHTESATLACDMGALSADHLLKISDSGIRRLALSKTVAVLLPGTAFYLKSPQAPARQLLDEGARVALATDFNPGTFMSLSLPAVMTIAALYLGMTCAEIFAAVTYNGAKALGLSSAKGTLEPGMDADFWILPFEKFEECYYRFAW